MKPYLSFVVVGGGAAVILPFTAIAALAGVAVTLAVIKREHKKH